MIAGVRLRPSTPTVTRKLHVIGLLAAVACGQALAREGFGRGVEPLTLEERVIAAAIAAAGEIPAPLRLPVPYCVSFRDTITEDEIRAPDLARLPVSRQLVVRSECPPTYASMIRVVDSLGRSLGPERPAGYVDPYHLTIWRPVRVTHRLLLVRIEATQGTRGWLLYCEISVPDLEHASCGTASEWIS